MDLPTVKASVKAWEKSFKAARGRDPTKDDIKKDPSGIGGCSPDDFNPSKSTNLMCHSREVCAV